MKYHIIFNQPRLVLPVRKQGIPDFFGFFGMVRVMALTLAVNFKTERLANIMPNRVMLDGIEVMKIGVDSLFILAPPLR